MPERRAQVTTFGDEPHSMFGAPPEARAEVMARVLECYANAGVRNERRCISQGWPKPHNLAPYFG